MKRIVSTFLVVLLTFCLCACTQMKIAYYAASATSATSNGNFEKAEGLYKKIIELEPKVAEHHWNLATIYISMRAKGKAEAEMKILRDMGRDDLADQVFLLLNQAEE